MFQLMIGKDDLFPRLNRAFDIDVIYYESKNGITDMRVPTRACSGYYINKNLREPDAGTSQTLSCLNDSGKLKMPIIIFNNTHIIRELTWVEKKNRKALEKFTGQDMKHPQLNLSETYEQVIRFKNIVELLKDKEKVNIMLPVPVESIAFIEMADTEGDFILSKEAEYIDTWEAINNNKFNIYKLW